MNGPRARRDFLARLAGAASALLLAGCDRLSRTAWLPPILESAESWNLAAQRLVTSRRSLAKEYPEADLSPRFRSNGTSLPEDARYLQLARNGFAGWALEVGGLVAQPLRLTLADLRDMPSRTQITRHDCVEGWSCIGEWTGTPLQLVLAMARPKDNARYAVFYCADPMGEATMDANGNIIQPPYYYESLDLLEATHPQTILAYGLNGQTLPVEHGAPVRLRAERQLGYKMPKYVQRIELTESFAHVGGGKGGYWEDQGYQWYGGI